MAILQAEGCSRVVSRPVLTAGISCAAAGSDHVVTKTVGIEPQSISVGVLKAKANVKIGPAVLCEVRIGRRRR